MENGTFTYEELTAGDEEECRYAVDIPPHNTGDEQPWLTVGYFETKEEAQQLAQDIYEQMSAMYNDRIGKDRI